VIWFQVKLFNFLNQVKDSERVHLERLVDKWCAGGTTAEAEG